MNDSYIAQLNEAESTWGSHLSFRPKKSARAQPAGILEFGGRVHRWLRISGASSFKKLVALLENAAQKNKKRVFLNVGILTWCVLSVRRPVPGKWKEKGYMVVSANIFGLFGLGGASVMFPSHEYHRLSKSIQAYVESGNEHNK